jgi:phytoene dehydrogenase-like protein
VSAGEPDAVVVGSGPNGLAAALTLARAGLRVDVYEGAAGVGGGVRSAELTLPGFVHDVCAAVHPLLAASPFFREARLPGIELLTPAIAVAHPLGDGTAACARGSVQDTADELGARDGRAYERLLGPLVGNAQAIVGEVLSPMLAPPSHPVAVARFGALGLWPATALASAFRGDHARALLAGMAAHAMQPLSAPGTSAFALMMSVLAHDAGWPVVKGGSERIADAIVAELEGAGAGVHTSSPVRSLAELPDGALRLLDVAPRGLLALAHEQLPERYARALRRFRYGPGVCKVDWALSAPVPWTAPECRETATIHLGGTFEEVARSEAEVAAGRHAERPFCIVVQACTLDPGRAPAGGHTLYAYCHVPNGSGYDMSDRIEAQIERFAPGFRELVLARSTMTAVDMQAHNPNYVGGDINSGAATLRQTILRPVASPRPYRVPLPRTYLCSSSTPPGGGVHGMCGQGAARDALRTLA